MIYGTTYDTDIMDNLQRTRVHTRYMGLAQTHPKPLRLLLTLLLSRVCVCVYVWYEDVFRVQVACKRREGVGGVSDGASCILLYHAKCHPVPPLHAELRPLLCWPLYGISRYSSLFPHLPECWRGMCQVIPTLQGKCCCTPMQVTPPAWKVATSAS